MACRYLESSFIKVKYFGNLTENVTRSERGGYLSTNLTFIYILVPTRGPCGDTEVLSRTAECVAAEETSEVAVNKKISQVNQQQVVFRDNHTASDHGNSSCEAAWQLEVAGSCYTLLDQGPCAAGEWLVLAAAEDQLPPRAECAPRPCPAPAVWWPALCECVGGADFRYSAAEVCGDTEQLVVSPRGEGVCSCARHHAADTAGECHELGGPGPCGGGQVWDLDPDTGAAQCGDNDNEVRVFELIPHNSAGTRTAQGARCGLDENGKCRKILNLRGRDGFGPDDGNPSSASAADFLSWLSSFPASSPSSCVAASCPGDSVAWTDGRCYQLASTGPCTPGSWLLLHSLTEAGPKSAIFSVRYKIFLIKIFSVPG